MNRDYVELRAIEKKPSLSDELAITGKWLILATGAFIFGLIILLGLAQLF